MNILELWRRRAEKGKVLLGSPQNKAALARVKDVMKEEVVNVDIGKSALEVAKIMMEKGVAAVLVTHEDKAVGIITERDLVRKVLAASANPLEVNAGSCMSAPLISIDPDALLSEAAKAMSSNKIRRLAVITDRKLQGIITSSDIARHLATVASHNDPFLNAIARKVPPRGVYA